MIFVKSIVRLRPFGMGIGNFAGLPLSGNVGNESQEEQKLHVMRVSGAAKESKVLNMRRRLLGLCIPLF